MITIKVNEEILNKMRDFYSDFIIDKKTEYINFLAKVDDKVITAYESKNKSIYKITFNDLNEALIWDADAKENEKKKIVKAHWLYLDDQIGSDEVGTGDFFGPICVCGTFIKSSQIQLLKDLKVNDSKKLSDEQICEIAKVLINNVLYSQISVDNEKINELIEKGYNMNSIKAELHNQVFKNLIQKTNCKKVFLDQFCEPKTYFNYLKNDKNLIKNISFKTKAESYYPSVAAGSIIARYSFIRKMEKLSEKYGMEIPYGASKNVDLFAQKFIKKYGIDELKKVVKCNFVNYKKLF